MLEPRAIRVKKDLSSEVIKKHETLIDLQNKMPPLTNAIVTVYVVFVNISECARE